MSGAAHHRGESRQDFSTPTEFIDAVKRKFDIGGFAWDLAADAGNSKADGSAFYSEANDALSKDWTKLRGNLWLNPPFANIAPWAAKCAATDCEWNAECATRRIFFLVPASVGSNWWAQHVDGRARVLLLNGRISFDGKGPYPKDCILAVYGEAPGYEVWRWRA